MTIEDINTKTEMGQLLLVAIAKIAEHEAHEKQQRTGEHHEPTDGELVLDNLKAMQRAVFEPPTE